MTMVVERDGQLDLYRAYVLIYIVCVIHVIWCLDFNFLLKPFSLWEMPAIFFIAGASSKMSKTRCLKDVVVGRFKRVLFPYYIYSVVCLLILSFICVLFPTIKVHPNSSICNYTLIDFFHVIICQEIKGIPYNNHIWFVVPYLLITISMYYQKTLIDKYKKKYVFGNIILFAILCLFFSDYLLYRSVNHEVSVRSFLLDNLFYFISYNIFFVGGYLYYKNMNVNSIIAIFILSLLLFVGYSLFAICGIPDLQSLKFPPQIPFVIYGILALCFLSLVLRIVQLRSNKILRIWVNKGYTLYLYQSIAYWIFANLYNRIIWHYNIHIGEFSRFCVSAVSIFIISILLSYITTPIEKFYMHALFSRK